MSTASKPPGKAMYVAPRPDWDWLQIEQRKLYARSEEQVDYVFRKLWGLVTDPRNLRMALARVAGNRGRARQAWTGSRWDTRRSGPRPSSQNYARSSAPGRTGRRRCGACSSRRSAHPGSFAPWEFPP